MIRIIEASYASFFPREMDAMFRSRAETFGDRLGWEVVVENGYERDRFDRLDPVYLVSVDPENGDYWGSLRLLPTIGPNMLRDVFAQLLDDGEQVADATIWESSRICVARDRQAERTRGGLNHALCELILGIGEVAILAGLTRIVSVFDARMLRILRATGCTLQIIGTPRPIGDVMCYAALFDTGAAALTRFRRSLGVSDTVFAPDAYEWIALAGERHTGMTFASGRQE
jgi:acyl homoserine lactone synthase